jgi:hypothetical protein
VQFFLLGVSAEFLACFSGFAVDLSALLCALVFLVMRFARALENFARNFAEKSAAE